MVSNCCCRKSGCDDDCGKRFPAPRRDTCTKWSGSYSRKLESVNYSSDGEVIVVESVGRTVTLTWIGGNNYVVGVDTRIPITGIAKAFRGPDGPYLSFTMNEFEGTFFGTIFADRVSECDHVVAARWHDQFTDHDGSKFFSTTDGVGEAVLKRIG